MMIEQKLDDIKKRINAFFNDERITSKFNNLLKKINYPEPEMLEDYSITQIIDLKRRRAELEKLESKFYSETHEIKNVSHESKKRKKRV